MSGDGANPTENHAAPLRQRAILYALLAITCLFGYCVKADCLWTAPSLAALRTPTLCYTDAAVFWLGSGIPKGHIPYLQSPVEYPVLTGAQMWIEGSLARHAFGHSLTGFIAAIVAVNTILAACTLELLIRMGLPRTRLVAWCASPLVVLYVGINWDMAAVLAAVAALFASTRGRYGWAGVAIGIGISAKLYPAVLLPPLAMAAISGGRSPVDRARDLVLLAGGAIITWAAINVPVAWIAYDNWSLFYRFSAARGPNIMSVWSLLERFHLVHLTRDARNLWAMGFIAVGSLTVLAVGAWRRTTPRWVLATPMVALFIMANKVWSAQFDLWLLPLALITCRSPVPIAIFVAGDAAAYLCEFWSILGAQIHHPPITAKDMAAVTALRAFAMGWMIVDGTIGRVAPWTRPATRSGSCRLPSA